MTLSTSPLRLVVQDAYYVADGAVHRGHVAVSEAGAVIRSTEAISDAASLVLPSAGRHIVLPGMSNAFSNPRHLLDAPSDVASDAALSAVSRGLTAITLHADFDGSLIARMLANMGVAVAFASAAPLNAFTPTALLLTAAGIASLKQHIADAHLISSPDSLDISAQLTALATWTLATSACPLAGIIPCATSPASLAVFTFSGDDADANAVLMSALAGTAPLCLSWTSSSSSSSTAIGQFAYISRDAYALCKPISTASASASAIAFEFDTVADAIDAIRRGEFVVVVDNEDRENEGDLIIAGEFMTTEKMAFMIRFTSALICISLPAERLEQLELPLMVTANNESFKTAFTVSVDYLHGTTTGISASDRAATCRALADLSCKSADFARPGHLFPLRYTEGGVLRRMGHTEAAGDLCMMAGVYPAGVLCEVALDCGEMARRDYLRVFSRLHGLKMISIADMIKYRMANGMETLKRTDNKQ